ncbi:MAG: hypothetical protein ABSE18_03860 [Minisyncoccia bacterium]|jgi:hypothetical protein
MNSSDTIVVRRSERETFRGGKAWGKVLTEVAIYLAHYAPGGESDDHFAEQLGAISSCLENAEKRIEEGIKSLYAPTKMITISDALGDAGSFPHRERDLIELLIKHACLKGEDDLCKLSERITWTRGVVRSVQEGIAPYQGAKKLLDMLAGSV